MTERIPFWTLWKAAGDDAIEDELDFCGLKVKVISVPGMAEGEWYLTRADTLDAVAELRALWEALP